MTEADIEREMKKRDILPSKKDSRRLRTIRVITGADIEKLRAIRESQDQKSKK